MTDAKPDESTDERADTTNNLSWENDYLDEVQQQPATCIWERSGGNDTNVVSIRQHSIRQHTSAYVSIRQHTYKDRETSVVLTYLVCGRWICTCVH